MKRFALAASLAALSLAASASPAGAAVTIGQTQDTNGTCAPGYDWVQPTVTSGNSYVVPATVMSGSITSWVTDANAFGGTLTMKVFRQVSGSTYMAVGHDGPRTLTAGAVNTFDGINVPVRAGDVLGVHAGTGNPACVFDVLGDAGLFYFGDLADGAPGAPFAPDVDDRLNIRAAVAPTNTFSLGTITRNKKKGTATLTATVPNPGELTGSGKGVKVAGAAGAVTSKTVSAPGEAKLTIKAKGKKKATLNETGKVKVKPTITYTPTGGDPSSQSRKVKLKKR